MVKWNKTDTEILINMFNDGIDYKTIANSLKTTPNAVRLKLGRLGLKKHSQKHKYKINEIVNDSLIIKSFYYDENNQKMYTVQSMTYPEAPLYEVNEYELNDGHKDSYTLKNRYKKVFEGNSLYSIKHIRSYLTNIEQAKSTSPNSRDVLKFKCPHCKTEKEMTTNIFIQSGLSCVCSVGLSYPELLFRSFNIQKNLGFMPEQVFDDFKDYRFDFVNYEKRIIVETHGLQHFEKSNNSVWANAYDRSVKSDKAKRKYCKENNWTLIELDCRESNFEFIINNIEQEKLLPTISKNDKLEILNIMETNKRYPIKEFTDLYKYGFYFYEIGKLYNVSPATVSNAIKLKNSL